MSGNGHNGNGGTADVQTYFERAADSFDRLYTEDRQSPFMRWVNRHFRSDIAERFLRTLALADKIRPASVLDVGCGSGRYLEALARHGVRQLVGVDLSSPMLDLARQATKDVDAASIDLRCGDYMDIEFDEAVDMSVVMGVFDYVDEPEKMLQRLRKDSRRAVIASFPSKHWFRTPVRKLRYRIKRCPLYFYDPESIRELGKRAGFASVDIEKINGAGMDYVAVMWVDDKRQESSDA